eukprot:m.131518 g.131518  ORF g.131518 m.131518 type:complete len:53 (+) comp20023_c0_seq3:4127-4285(+)
MKRLYFSSFFYFFFLSITTFFFFHHYFSFFGRHVVLFVFSIVFVLSFILFFC